MQSTDIQSLECMYVCLCVRRLIPIVRSSSNLKCRSHICDLPSPPLDNIRIMVIRTTLCCIVWHNVHSLQCFDTVGLVIWPVKIVPEMTYYVWSGRLNPTHSLTWWPITPEVVNAHAPQFSSSRLAHFMLVSTTARLFLVYFWSNLVRRSTLPEKNATATSASDLRACALFNFRLFDQFAQSAIKRWLTGEIQIGLRRSGSGHYLDLTEAPVVKSLSRVSLWGGPITPRYPMTPARYRSAW